MTHLLHTQTNVYKFSILHVFIRERECPLSDYPVLEKQVQVRDADDDDYHYDYNGDPDARSQYIAM